MTTKYDTDSVKSEAKGCWQSILSSLAGIPAKHLDGKHSPCPKCEGTNRFNSDREQFTDTGLCHCNQKCGLTGDGFHLLMELNGWDFKAAVNHVGEFLACNAVSTVSKQKRTKEQPTGTPYPIAVETTLKSVRSRLPAGVTVPDQPDRSDRYQHADGTPAGVTLRWNRSDGQKEIRPLSVSASGWICKAMADPRPLYNLPAVQKSDTVYLLEGEKAAEAANTFGIVAVASAGGASAARKTDWTPLDGKRIIVVPDNDSPGREYLGKVQKLLQQQAPSAEVFTADLSKAWPEIPEAGDCADWSEAFDSQPPEWFREQLEAIAKPAIDSSTDGQQNKNALSGVVDTSSVSEGIQTGSVDRHLEKDDFEPFPILCLPDAIQCFVEQASKSVGVDPAFLVLPILSVCAAAIGHSRSLLVKQGWSVPSILWTAVIGESGSGKSPAFRLAVEPLKNMQRDCSKKFATEQAQFFEDTREHKRLLKLWEREPKGEAPLQPLSPTHQQLLTSDTTVQGLGPVLNDNPRGIILARDELSGWLASFDKFSGKSAVSSDVTNWLEFYNAEFSIVNRKSAEQRFLAIDRPSVSVCGGIQPGILSKCLTSENKDNGLQSRLMLAYPPRQQKRWRDDELPHSEVAGYSQLIAELHTLKPNTDLDGHDEPALLRLDADAREMMVTFINSHGSEQNAMTGHTASQWSKLEEIPARIVIIIHCVRQVSEDVPDAFCVDGDSMQAAIQIAEWFKSEALRINRLLTEDENTRNARQLADWIQQKGGSITARNLYRNRRDVKSTEQAELMLSALVSQRVGDWQGIHASRQFVMRW